jgi:hypothetical protein
MSLASRAELLSALRALLPPGAEEGAGIHGLCNALRAAGKLDAAVALYATALEAHPATRTSNDPQALIVCHHAAAVLLESGALDAATPTLLAACAGWGVVLSAPQTGGDVAALMCICTDLMNALITVSHLADALEKERRAEDAVVVLDDALGSARKPTASMARSFIAQQSRKLEERRAALRAKWWCANAGCQVGGGGAVRLLKCGGCRAVAYCSQACQREAWAAHRPACAAQRSAQ